MSRVAPPISDATPACAQLTPHGRQVCSRRGSNARTGRKDYDCLHVRGVRDGGSSGSERCSYLVAGATHNVADASAHESDHGGTLHCGIRGFLHRPE